MLGACGAWRLRSLAPAALGACGAWRLRRFAPAALGAIFCLGWPLEASRGPDEPESVFSGYPQSNIIMIDHFWARWTLSTCSNMPYTTFIPTIVCLIWPPEAQMSPKQCFRDVPSVILSRCILSTLDASDLPQYAIYNFHSYHCLFGLTSRGLERPPQAMRIFVTFERYYRDVSLMGPFRPFHNIGGDVAPTLGQV